MKEAYSEELISFEEQHKVVQTNTSYYDLKWRSVQNPAKENSWNWIAFFFSTFWLAYRKMYKPFFMLGLAEILWMIPSYFVDVPLWLDIPFYLAMSLLVGWSGNRWYYNHTSQVLEQAKVLTESQQDSYLRTKGGTHIGIMLGLHALLFVFYIVSDIGLSYLPTETNVKNAVRLSGEGETLEAFTDEPKWNYVKKEGRHHVIEFTGYDYSENEDVRIFFYVYLDKQIYEWKQIYINGEKLNETEAEDYELWIEDNSWY
ncbi:hypothetical protein J2S09_001274 [Bacillus fengqiuensis]|nr:hypothetical protein [Bacillus fengqiuensis]